MSTDITRGPKVCPSCGEESLPLARRCWLCLTPFAGAVQTAPAPGAAAVADRPPPVRRPLGDDRDDDYPELPGTASLFQRRLPIVTAVLIIPPVLVAGLWLFELSRFAELPVLVGISFGLAVLLIPTPALVRLFRVGRVRAAEPPPESRNPALQTIGVMIAAPLIAMLVVASAFIAFVAVCFPVGWVGIQHATDSFPIAFPIALALGVMIGSLAASFAAYWVARCFFRRKRH